MFKIFVLLLLLKCPFVKSANDSSNTYAIPCNTQYPYGDEQQFECNLLDNSTSQVNCMEQKDIALLKGKCPTEESNENLLDPYIGCPAYPIIPPPHELIFSSGNQPAPQVQCKKCDLRLTADNSAVVLECFQCFDIPSPSRPANRTERDILYKVYFIQIANYTSVEITGSQYFDSV